MAVVARVRRHSAAASDHEVRGLNTLENSFIVKQNLLNLNAIAERHVKHMMLSQH